MTTSRSAAWRELLVVIGLAAFGVLLAAVVAFGVDPVVDTSLFAPIVDITSPDSPLS
jgi:hypothetical protein